MIEATNELYLANKKSIEKACWDAWRKNPVITIDDYRSYADEIFVDATRTYNENAGARFNTWLMTQLLRLKNYAARYIMATTSTGTADTAVLSLDKPVQGKTSDGAPCSLCDMKQPVNDAYSASLCVPEWAMDWESRFGELKLYMTGLSQDARVMVDDILDGAASKKDEHGVPMPERGRKMYAKLTPRQLYIRLYARRGWCFERVRDARLEVENMLRRWEPCKLPETETEIAAAATVVDELF